MVYNNVYYTVWKDSYTQSYWYNCFSNNLTEDTSDARFGNVLIPIPSLLIPIPIPAKSSKCLILIPIPVKTGIIPESIWIPELNWNRNCASLEDTSILMCEAFYKPIVTRLSGSDIISYFRYTSLRSLYLYIVKTGNFHQIFMLSLKHSWSAKSSCKNNFSSDSWFFVKGIHVIGSLKTPTPKPQLIIVTVIWEPCITCARNYFYMF